ncbi:MAG: MFS transporter [Dehalococcoidales bacterium]|nr:MFS transporter [Dehalococcoidales bacterium]
MSLSMKKPASFVKEVEEELGEEVQQLTGNKTSILSGLVGNIMEWYDFALYGYMVPIISQLFFPSQNNLSSIMSTFAVFAAGFIMRPIGGIILGRVGDIKGRKTTLYISMILMAVCTALMGVLPTYKSVGLAAPVLLVLLRLFQGLSVGGEFSTSVSYMVEEAPKNSRGIFGSLANIGSMTGMVMGAAVAAAVSTFIAKESLLSWGWRLPFFLAAILGIIGMYYTIKMPKSHLFVREKRHEEVASIREVFTSGRRELIQAMLFCLGYTVLFYLPLVYMPTYVHSIAGMDENKALQITTVATFLLIFLIPMMAILSDRFIRRRSILITAFLIALVCAVPMFILAVKSYILLFSVLVLFGIIIAVPLGVAPATLVEWFPTKYRLTSYSVIYNIGVGIFGGSTPMICTWLIKTTGNNLAPAYYLGAFIIISLVGLFLMKDRSRDTLR